LAFCARISISVVFPAPGNCYQAMTGARSQKKQTTGSKDGHDGARLHASTDMIQDLLLPAVLPLAEQRRPASCRNRIFEVQPLDAHRYRSSFEACFTASPPGLPLTDAPPCQKREEQAQECANHCQTCDDARAKV
jgi:hypothetical protein